jgi:hypothetical protein
MKRGNRNRKDPDLSEEGRAAPGKRTDGRKHHGYFRLKSAIFWDKMSTKQRQIAEAARKYPGESLKSVGGLKSDII